MVDGFDHMQEGGMGTSEALTELDQVAGEDVGTLYGDRDRDGTISVGEEIRRAVADAWKDGIGLGSEGRCDVGRCYVEECYIESIC